MRKRRETEKGREKGTRGEREIQKEKREKT